MPPSRDDFARWRDDFVTRWVMRAFEQMAEDNKAEWIRVSWDAEFPSAANTTELRQLKIRADTYLAMSQSTYEGFCETNGEQPRDE